MVNICQYLLIYIYIYIYTVLRQSPGSLKATDNMYVDTHSNIMYTLIYIEREMSKASGVHFRTPDPPMGDPEAFRTVWKLIDASGGLYGASDIHKTGLDGKNII